MSVFYEILAELYRKNLSEQKSVIPARIVLARETIEGEYCDPCFSVTALAERVGVSSAYLRREFRAAYGESPVGCLKRLRIERARLLLLTDHGSVASIAARCGYSGTSYFIQDFHRSTGESPGSYRARLLDSP
jgi:AraC-like DNA-binding protein